MPLSYLHRYNYCLTVSRPTHHCERKVRCNGSEYALALPLEAFRFVEIAQQIVFGAEQEALIATLSGQRSVLPSFEQFYRLQEDGLRYFNLRVELNCDDLALKLLSETDKILVELDRCRFPDLLALLRRAYDTYAKKLHSKFNRRIKKYLAISTRSEAEKQQVEQLLELIKADSTDEEVLPEKDQPKKQPSEKVIKNVEPELKKEPSKRQKERAEKKAEKEEVKEEKKEEVKGRKEELKAGKKEERPSEKPAKKDEKHSKFQEELQKEKKIKKGKILHQEEHHKEEEKEEDWEDVHSEEEKPKPPKKKHEGHRKKKEEEEDEEEWEDVHEEKIHKRLEKNNRRKHEKFDLEGKKENQPSGEDRNNYSEPTQREREPRRNNNHGNNNGRNSNRNLFERSKDRPKKDLRVLLGLNGDTDDGWRERYRVERVPAQLQAEKAGRAEKGKKKWVVKEEQQSVEKGEAREKGEASEKGESRSPFQKQPQPDKQAVEQKGENPAEAPKLVIIPSQGALEKVFSFPADGKQFVLDPAREYRVRVNNSFWIMLEKGSLTIEKEKAGYIRDGKFRSSEESLIEAQDITISLNGMCNLEDGGAAFGSPRIENFTGTDSQWFHLKELEVYAYK